MRAALTDLQMEETLDRDGYLIVNFLEPDELEEVKTIVSVLGYGKDNEEKFRRTVNKETTVRKNEIYDKFYPVLLRAVDRFLQDYKIVRIGVFDKLPGGGPLNIHQHATLVDESKHNPLTAWIPVVDTTEKMGTLYLVKGSHNIFDNRTRPYNDADNSFQTKLSHRILKKYSVPLLLKAGQAAIFQDRLLHWSPPNKSSKIRTAIQLKLLPREAETDLTMYYRINDEELLKYQVDQKTYNETNLSGKKPDDWILLGRIEQSKFIYNNRQFITKMQAVRSDSTEQHRNLFQRLFNL